jgi:hypothetical protein
VPLQCRVPPIYHNKSYLLQLMVVVLSRLRTLLKSLHFVKQIMSII